MAYGPFYPALRKKRKKSAPKRKTNPEGMRKGLGGMYELFYSYGGHGGPYSSLTEARKWARNLIKGDPHHLKWVKIKRYSHRGVGGFGATVDTIYRSEQNPKSNPLARAIPARLIPDGKGGYRVFVNAKRAGMAVRNPKGKGKRQLDVFDTHMLRIARQTLKMSDVGARITGGQTKEEARAIIRRLGGGEAEIRRLEK